MNYNYTVKVATVAAQEAQENPRIVDFHLPRSEISPPEKPRHVQLDNSPPPAIIDCSQGCPDYPLLYYPPGPLAVFQTPPA